MKLMTIFVCLIHILSVLLTMTWNFLALLTEALVNDENNSTNIVGNHFVIGGNEWGDDTEIVKRAGNHYTSDRESAIYERNIRH